MMNLTKHHGLGNDFLVVTRPWGTPVGDPVDVELTTTVCDRRRGIGADGLLFLSLHPDNDAELAMVLLNADGSRAEMSGNGIRCLTHAAYRAQGRSGPAGYVVHTDAGIRTVAVRPTDDPHTVLAEVDMGTVAPLAEPHGWAAIGCDPMRPVAHLSLGNPHSVVGVEDVRIVDLVAIGAQVPHVNLEIIEPGPELHAITMRVHERGAGITEACGTGACASAWAATTWGLVPASAAEILVHMDGGDASVRLHQPRPGHVTLIGPATFVAEISI